MYDCIIIGKGPAGISASIYLKRSNFNCLVIGKESTALEKATCIENYYGFPEPITGEELYERGIEQAKKLGIQLITEEVIGIEYEDFFSIITNSYQYKAKTVLLATGKSRNIPKINGIDKLEGKGISYCAICDAFFYRNKNIAVIGNGEYAIHEAEILSNVGKSVTILTNGKELPQNRSISELENIEVIENKISGIEGENKVESVKFQDRGKLPVEGVFIAEGTASSVDFAKRLGAILNDKDIAVSDNMETNVPNLYAAGDCTGGIFQINKAVYEGAKAALSIVKKLRKEKEGGRK